MGSDAPLPTTVVSLTATGSDELHARELTIYRSKAICYGAEVQAHADMSRCRFVMLLHYATKRQRQLCHVFIQRGEHAFMIHALVVVKHMAGVAIQ